MSLCYERAKEEEKTGKEPTAQGGTRENVIKMGNEMVWGPGSKPVKFPSHQHQLRPQLISSGLGITRAPDYVAPQ